MFSALLLLGLASCLACASDGGMPREFPGEELAVEPNAPLGGEALANRKQEMQRAHRDLRHFHATLESLRYRQERSGSILLAGFLEGYLGRHLDPMLASETQSRHPELMGIDADLRLAKAELLRQMRDPRGVQQAIDELLRRFEGRLDMLVEYPFGQQNTLREGIQILTEGKWRG